MILFVFGEGYGDPSPNKEEGLSPDVEKGVGIPLAGVKRGHPQAPSESPAVFKIHLIIPSRGGKTAKKTPPRPGCPHAGHHGCYGFLSSNNRFVPASIIGQHTAILV